MATAVSIPKAILITTLPTSISPNNTAYIQTNAGGGLSSKILAAKRPYSIVSSPPLLNSQNQLTNNNSLNGNNWLPATVQRTYKYETVDDDYYDDSSEDQSQYVDSDQPPRKRERLTHLSPEEKMFRRKMKNRIAAQTARDRKKALMVELEDTCRRLEEENDSLALENTKLRQTQSTLAEENERLKKLLAEQPKPNPTTCRGQDDVRTVCAFGPAESIYVPLPKEQAKAGWALTWLIASALIQLCSTSCGKSSASEVENLRMQLEELKKSGSLTLEDVMSRCPPEAMDKLWAIIRSYKMMDAKPP